LRTLFIRRLGPVVALCAITASTITAYPSAHAQSQTYPKGTVRLIAPYGPGGMVDVLGRAITQRISEVTGHPYVVENRAGGSGLPAVQQLLNSPADGHTLMLSDIQQLAINPFLLDHLPYDPIKDLAPVSLIGSAPLYLVVQSALNINTLDELIAAAKAAPGKFNYGSSGNGSIHHISMEAIKASLGLNITHIPYRGAAQTATGIMTGEISIMLSAYNNLTPLLESGKGKILALTTAKRSTQEPNVPSVSERIPDYDFSTKVGIVARAGTPPEIVAIASKQITDALRYAQTDPRLANVFRGVDFSIVGSTPESYAKDIKSDYDRFEKAVKISGAKDGR
jgi:tripartite-type tricarboxylate transporter receptor subunit TctC